MNEEVERLRVAILARHATLYAFCQKTGLPRGTVYQVMRLRYAGNSEVQLARIRAALDGKAAADEHRQAVIKALAGAACAACECGKKACRKKRHTCRQLWQAQATAICALPTGGFRT